MLRELLSNVQHVKKLTFGFWCLQIVTTLLEVKSLHSPLMECKSLMLKAIIRERELLGMARLLSNLPHLETLTNDPSECYCRSDFLDLYEDKRKVSPTSEEKILNSCLLLHHLKTVKILGFHLCSEKQIMSLVELLLKNASVLETMVFVVSPNYCHHSEAYPYYDIVSGYNKDGLLKLSLKLLGFPRSSPLSKISLSGRCIWERDDF